MLFSAVSVWICFGLLAALLVVVPLTSTALYMRRYRLTVLQALLLQLNTALNRLRWRTRTNRRIPIGPGQGAIIISNHRSSIDPLFLQAIAPRLIHWMFAKEYARSKWLGWFFRAVGAIPAGRAGIDTAAVKQAIRLAAAGELIGMMPEGRINETQELLVPGRPGRGAGGLEGPRAGCSLLYLRRPYDGTVAGPLLMPARVTVAVGEPIDLTPYYDRVREPGVLEELTKRFMKEIAHLAGRDDFEPQLAGRRWKPEEAEESDETDEAAAEPDAGRAPA